MRGGGEGDNMLKVVIAALLVVGLVSVGGAPTSVSAQETPKKVFVCKYVGTPGEDERLQTGQNPISVSVNAIPEFEGVGSYFADQHGRSYVLEYDEGQEEPDVTECPGADGPLVASAEVLITPATCEVGETLVYGDIENAEFTGTANGTVGEGNYVVTATADEGAVFYDEEGAQSSELVLEGDLDGALTGDDCVLSETPDPEVLPNTSGTTGGIALISGVVALLAAGFGIRRLLAKEI